MWNLKKGQNFFAEQMLTQRLCKTYDFQMRQDEGWGDALGVWDGNYITLGSDNHCTTKNVIYSLSNIERNTHTHVCI